MSHFLHAVNFEIGSKVHIDNDKSIIGIIVCIEIHPQKLIRYAVSWMHGGDAKFIVFDEWRLSPA